MNASISHCLEAFYSFRNQASHVRVLGSAIDPGLRPMRSSLAILSRLQAAPRRQRCGRPPGDDLNN